MKSGDEWRFGIRYLPDPRLRSNQALGRLRPNYSGGVPYESLLFVDSSTWLRCPKTEVTPGGMSHQEAGEILGAPHAG
jgi:hypothetical protein